MLPVPKLVVFYNGLKESDDEVIFRLRKPCIGTYDEL